MTFFMTKHFLPFSVVIFYIISALFFSQTLNVHASLFSKVKPGKFYFSNFSCFGPLFQGQKVMVRFLNNFSVIHFVSASKCDLVRPFSTFDCKDI